MHKFVLHDKVWQMNAMYKDVWIMAAINGPEATAGGPNGIRCFLYKKERDLGKKRKVVPLKKLIFFCPTEGFVTLEFKSTKDANGLLGWNKAFGDMMIKEGVGVFTVKRH